MKIIFEPSHKTTRSKEQLQDLKDFLQTNGFKTNVITTKPRKGELGRGIAGGLATILTGGETLFSKLGDALIKYVEGRRTEVTMKNTKGEEITLSASLPRNQIRGLINEFFERNIAPEPLKEKTPKQKNDNQKVDKKILAEKTPKKEITKNTAKTTEPKKTVKKNVLSKKKVVV